MADEVTVKSRYDLEAEREAAKARDRAYKRAIERDVVSEGFKAHTEGEKRFNDLTYTGVGYFGVTGFSVLLTWLFRDKMGGAFEKAAEWVTKNASFVAKNKNTAQSILTVGALFTGGSIMTVTGVKMLEDNKAKIVKGFDKQIYGEEAVNNDPELVAAHKAMESQPKQTWASVGGSRITAFGATLASLFLIGANSGFLSKRIGTSFDTLGVQFGRWGGRLLNKAHPDKIADINSAISENIKLNEVAGANTNFRELVKGKDTQWTRILSYAGTDALYTVITAVGLFVSTRMLAPIFDKNGMDQWGKQKNEKQSHKQEAPANEHVKPIPIDQLERAQDETLPRVRVSNVQSLERISTKNAEQQVGASA